MGVRESSGALSYTLGDGKYAGFHVEVCQRVLADVQKQLGLAKLDIKYQPVTSQNRIPLVQNGTVDIECGSTTNNATRQKDVAFALDHLRRGSAHRGQGQLGHHLDRPAERQERRHHHRHHLGAARCASTSAPPASNFKEVFGKDHADSFLLLEIGPRRRVRDGRPDPGRQHRQVEEPGRLQDRRRGAVGRADRHHDPQGRPGVQEGRRRQHRGDDEVAATSPSCTTSGSCSRSRRANTKVGLPLPATPPRRPGRRRTTSRWKTTPRSKRATAPAGAGDLAGGMREERLAHLGLAGLLQGHHRRRRGAALLRHGRRHHLPRLDAVGLGLDAVGGGAAR